MINALDIAVGVVESRIVTELNRIKANNLDVSAYLDLLSDISINLAGCIDPRAVVDYEAKILHLPYDQISFLIDLFLEVRIKLEMVEEGAYTYLVTTIKRACEVVTGSKLYPGDWEHGLDDKAGLDPSTILRALLGLALERIEVYLNDLLIKDTP